MLAYEFKTQTEFKLSLTPEELQEKTHGFLAYIPELDLALFYVED